MLKTELQYDLAIALLGVYLKKHHQFKKIDACQYSSTSEQVPRTCLSARPGPARRPLYACALPAPDPRPRRRLAKRKRSASPCGREPSSGPAEQWHVNL